MDPNLTQPIILNATLNATLIQPSQPLWKNFLLYSIPAIGVIVALVFNSWQMIRHSKEKNIFVFINLAETYESNRKERIINWVKLKNAVKSNEKISHEIGDKTSSVSSDL